MLFSKNLFQFEGSHQLGNVDRRLLALPIHLGGLGLVNPTHTLADHYSISVSICLSLINCFFSSDIVFHPLSCLEEQHEIKFSLLSERLKMQVEQANELRSQLAPSLQHSMDLSRKKRSFYLAVSFTLGVTWLQFT